MAATGVLVAALTVVGSGLAAGGNSIKTAPTVQFGVQTFGNTENGGAIGNGRYEWWLLPLIAGDHLTVKFENSSPKTGTNETRLFPPGTDDFNLSKTDPVEHEYIESNAHGQIDFDVPSTGVYPIHFYGCVGCSLAAGAYDFTAGVLHTARLVWPPSPQVVRTGAFVLQARFPDGQVVKSGLGGTLFGYWDKTWHQVGKGAVANGALRIRYTIPAVQRGKRIKLRVGVGGPSFKGAKITRSVTVR